MNKFLQAIWVATSVCLASVTHAASPTQQDLVWQLPSVPHPADNAPNAARVELGKALFFDPRLSADGNMSCATCHNPSLGWSDGLPTAKGFRSKVLGRATPSIYNAAYNGIQMWDGRKSSLEHQATGPLESPDEMATDFDALFKFLNANSTYKQMFANAYPSEPIGKATIAKAIASYERTVVANNSPFDRWLRGEANAMNEQQRNGYRVFVDSEKGNCAACHQAPNFTDDGFHNIGLASFGVANPDVGRFAHRAVRVVKGAFKTPSLRNITRTAPYFHDGSAKTLMEVVEHYARGGEVKTNLSPNMKQLNLTPQEKLDLVAFMEALTGDELVATLPILP